MTDRELDQMVAETAPVSDAWVASLDLRGADTDLLEVIVATDLTDEAHVGDLGPTDAGRGVSRQSADLWPAARPRRARYRVVVGVAVTAAAVAAAVLGVRSGADDSERDNDTSSDVRDPVGEEVPRLLAGWVPDRFELANTLTEVTSSDGVVRQVDDDSQQVEGGRPTYTAYYSTPASAAGIGWIDIITSPSPGSRIMHGAESSVTVRGHDGTLYTSPAQGSMIGSVSLRWDDAPGVTVVVSANNSSLTADDVVRIAESLHPVSQEEWDRGSNLNTPLDPAALQALVPEDAAAFAMFDWRGTVAYLSATGEACAFLADNRGQTETVCGPPDEPFTLLLDRVGFPAMLFGVLPEGATDVLATQGGGDVLHDSDFLGGPPQVHLVPDPASARVLYALNVSRPPDLLTFVDAQGQPVESVPLDIQPDI